MLIPQFSLRWLLGVTTGTAAVCAVVAWGIAGHGWALAVAFGLAAATALMLTYAVMFSAIWTVSTAFSRSARAGRSPFRTDATTRKS